MEILYHYIDTYFTWGWSPFTTLCAAALVIWFGIFIVDKIYKKSYDDNTKFFAACVFVFILFAGILSMSLGKKVSYDVYKVTIDESSIDYVEFLDTYEILGQEGKIYTIKYRE